MPQSTTGIFLHDCHASVPPHNSVEMPVQACQAPFLSNAMSQYYQYGVFVRAPAVYQPKIWHHEQAFATSAESQCGNMVGTDMSVCVPAVSVPPTISQYTDAFLHACCVPVSPLHSGTGTAVQACLVPAPSPGSVACLFTHLPSPRANTR